MRANDLTTQGACGTAFGRRFQAWVSIICLMSQFSLTTHMLLVEHVKCAEHGEWVHSSEHPQNQLAQSHVAHLASAEESRVLFAGSEANHEHDDCVLCSERSRLATFATVCHLLPRTSEQVQKLSGERAPFMDSRAVYDFAPKTSPPV